MLRCGIMVSKRGALKGLQHGSHVSLALIPQLITASCHRAAIVERLLQCNINVYSEHE